MRRLMPGLVLLIIGLWTLADAHKGTRDAIGCHWDRTIVAKPKYVCHEGALKDLSFTPDEKIAALDTRPPVPTPVPPPPKELKATLEGPAPSLVCTRPDSLAPIVASVWLTGQGTDKVVPGPGTVEFTIDGRPQATLPLDAMGAARFDWHLFCDWTPAGTYTLGAVATLTDGTRIAASTPFTVTAPAGQPTPPTSTLFDRYLAKLKEYAPRVCAYITDGNTPGDKKLASTYYDGPLIFLTLRELTNDSQWDRCAVAALDAYGGYVIHNGGSIPGYWGFPDGLAKTGISKWKDAVRLMAEKMAYGRGEWPDTLKPQDGSREVAYNLRAKIVAAQLNLYGDSGLMALMAEYAHGHVAQWFGCGTPPCSSASFMRPFMAGITGEALIRWYEFGHDARVPREIQQMADAIWRCCWLQDRQTFKYTDRDTNTGGQSPEPDLNMLVSPLYAWTCQHTHDQSYCQKFDQIVEGFLNGATNLQLGKQLNQGYEFGFKAFKWRQGT